MPPFCSRTIVWCLIQMRARFKRFNKNLIKHSLIILQWVAVNFGVFLPLVFSTVKSQTYTPTCSSSSSRSIDLINRVISCGKHFKLSTSISFRNSSCWFYEQQPEFVYLQFRNVFTTRFGWCVCAPSLSRSPLCSSIIERRRIYCITLLAVYWTIYHVYTHMHKQRTRFLEFQINSKWINAKIENRTEKNKKKKNLATHTHIATLNYFRMSTKFETFFFRACT